MKKSIFLSLLVFVSIHVFAQKEGNNWFFGRGAGITFNTEPPSIVSGSPISTDEGCSSISDKKGNLLFYSDGMTVWDKNHTPMPNGTGLLGDMSSTQSGVIVPVPNSSTLFYVFTVDDWGGEDGLCYSIVDLSKNKGLGDVTQKNIKLHSPSTEKVTAVKHFNQTAFWIVSHPLNTNKFYTYLLTESGICVDPIVSNAGRRCTQALGYMKASPDGSYIGFANQHESYVELYDFDNKTGQVGKSMSFIGFPNPYGLEFSADSRKMYFSSKSMNIKVLEIHQLDLSNSDTAKIRSSLLLIDTVSGYARGALQLAPNGKIYIAKGVGNTLGVINDPSKKGVECNLKDNALDLGDGYCVCGLPTFIQSIFIDVADFNCTNLCFNDQTLFKTAIPTNIKSIKWDFGDGESSDLISPTHRFPSPGKYTVNLTITSESGMLRQASQLITINDKPKEITISHN